jgi:putative tricarboxylic transport membrane protein
MQRADVVAGTVVAALGAFALVTALNLAFLSQSGVPGPGFFPTILSGLLVVFGIALAVISLRKRQAADTDADIVVDGDITDGPTRRVPGELVADGPTGPTGRSRVMRAGSVWLCFLVAVPVLTYLGFVPAMAILIAVLLFGVERRFNWRSLVLAVVVPVGVYELFVHLLSIPLPTGVIVIGPLSS